MKALRVVGGHAMAIVDEFDFALAEWSRVSRKRDDPYHPEVLALQRVVLVLLSHMLMAQGLNCDIRSSKIVVVENGIPLVTVALMRGTRTVNVMSHLVHPMSPDWSGRPMPEYVSNWINRHRGWLPQILERFLHSHGIAPSELSHGSQ